MSRQEREAVSIFLHDLYHHKQIKRRMYKIKEKFDKKDLLALVDDLGKKGILDEEEKRYLYKKINGLYKR